MKRQHIKARTVLAVRHGTRTGTPYPAVVIDTETLWTMHRVGGVGVHDGELHYERADGWRCSRDELYRKATGYLVITYSAYVPAEKYLTMARRAVRLSDAVAAVPTELDEDTVNAFAARLPEGVNMGIDDNRGFLGPWDEVMATEQQQREAEMARLAAEQQRGLNNARMFGRIVTAMRGRGDIDVETAGVKLRSDGTVSVPLELLAHLVDVPTAMKRTPRPGSSNLNRYGRIVGSDH